MCGVTHGLMMMHSEAIYSRILRKMQRALRNGTGCQLGNEELAALLHSDAWMLLAKAEWEEFKQENPRPNGNANA